MDVADSTTTTACYGSDNASNCIKSKTVYIGNLHEDTTEPLLCALFSQFGPVKSCKMLKDGTPGGDKYAFIEYDEHKVAEMAIQTMNGRVFLGKTIKVNWASAPFSPGNRIATKLNKQSHHPIFVGDISNEVTETDLQDAFSKYGDISDCRIIRDPLTLKCKNYGFITFVTREAAENAIQLMNGYWIGNRSIRTNWADKKMMTSNQTTFPVPKASDKPTYEQIESRSSPRNSTIFCGNFTKDLSESLLSDMFSRFGAVSSVRAFSDKGYGFVNFFDKSSAVKAILEMNGSNISGDTIKVSWGKELVPEESFMGYGGAGQSDAALWQQAQHYQNAFAMLMQQQSFYQTNAHVVPQFPAESYLSQEQGQQHFPYSNTVASTNQQPRPRRWQQNTSSLSFNKHHY